MQKVDNLMFLKETLQTHFEAELILKEREKRSILLEIQKGEAILKKYDIHVESGPSVVTENISIESLTPLQPDKASSKNSDDDMDVDMPDSSALIVMRDDGILVKMICPDCIRSDFANLQGFVNHCRIKHGRVFSTHMMATRLHGVIMDKKWDSLSKKDMRPTAFTRPEPGVVMKSSIKVLMMEKLILVPPKNMWTYQY
ncbi:hypothetical protein BC829DRAFT_237852 [Chytridium lagenaria]|nr:hypothetical protein BC829DRAFT_237852 [Chytridium lagenaria]